MDKDGMYEISAATIFTECFFAGLPALLDLVAKNNSKIRNLPEKENLVVDAQNLSLNRV